MKHFILTALLLTSAIGLSSFQTPNPESKMEPASEITLTILYDNYPYADGYKNNWGFSCLIEGTGQTILFDTGGRDGSLMHNFRMAGKDPKEVDLIVLSHIHHDHTGGMDKFLETHRGIEVYMPRSFPQTFKSGMEAKGALVAEVGGPTKISDHVWSTGEMGREIIEQSLVVETPGGLVIITGCAHPGISEIVAKALEIKEKEILLVMGGFHLLRTDQGAVEALARGFRDQHIKYAAPTHCSGDGTIRIFQETFGERYLRLGTGRVIQTAAL
jgi:7,8-dihydropterin-6-yl-methyl-4-(beta-D-ribofuranosyl)aminobenzene 5'-phosphate synthase